ncbi:protein of unknown function [Micrococcales bacterium KH10]|nr:protein of unknown function [Micrococcales bacterium KH10]
MTEIDIDEWEGPDSQSPRARPKWRTWQVTLAIVAIGASVAVAAWFAFGNPDNSVAASEISFTVHGPEETTLVFDITKPTDMTVVCTVEALSHNYLQVGFQEITLGPAETANQRVTTTISTTEKAVTAIVKTCLPE